MDYVEQTFKHAGRTGLASQTIRFIGAGLVALGFMVGIPMTSNAGPIQYNVSRVIGTGTVTGTITTDGSIGTGLSGGIITGYNLQLDTGTLTATLAGPPISIGIGGTPLTATATTISFDFDIPPTVFVGFGNPGEDFDNQWFLGSLVDDGSIELVNVKVGGVFSEQIVTRTGFVTFATGGAPIPEPGTILLFGSGLVGLLAWRMTRSREEGALQPLTPQVEA